MNDELTELRERIAGLEKDIGDLQNTVGQLRQLIESRTSSHETARQAQPPLPTPQSSFIDEQSRRQIALENKNPTQKPMPTTKPIDTKKPFELPSYMKKSEFWLNKIGIALILFSVVFAFKYSIDKGWLTPPIRIVFGIFLGLILLGTGIRIYDKRRPFSLVLLGGGIATFYITDFAAFQLFELVSHPVAFGLMTIITVFAYGLSLRQNEPVLSLIGILGGLGTPFLLYTGQGNIPGLVLYTCLIVISGMAIYFFKGWRSLLIPTVIGGWTILSIALLDMSPISTEQKAIQSGIIVFWLLYWLLPLSREVLARLKPDTWAHSPLLLGGKPIAPEVGEMIHHYVHLLSVSTPLIALGMSMSIWEYSDLKWGIITLIASLLYAGITWTLIHLKIRLSLRYTNGLVGLLLFSLSLAFFLSGDTLLIAFGAEAFAIFLIARKQNSIAIAIPSYVLYAFLGLWVFYRATNLSPGNPPLFNAKTLSELWVIATMIAVFLLTTRLIMARFFIVIASILLATILRREFSGNVEFFALSIETILLLAYAQRRQEPFTFNYSFAFTVVISLYLVDRLLFKTQTGYPIANWQSITDLFFLGECLATTLLLKPPDKNNVVVKTAFGLLFHLGFLLWMLREISQFPNGQGFVTVGWGIYAIVLLIVGMRRNFHKVRITALLTLFFVIGKLFLVDLSRIEAIWRVLIFLGFGGIFLMLSYYFKSLWKTTDEVDGTMDN